MTEWIKENKVAATLLLVAILGAIGTYFFSGKKSDEFQEGKDAFDMSASTLQKLEGRKPYPNTGNLAARSKAVKDYRGKVQGLQKALLAYPKDLTKITPAEFTTRLNEVGNKLKDTYNENQITYPETWQLGFEVYTVNPPKDEATPYLNYQLSGLEWLYDTLAKSGPSELLNVYRPKLPAEDGQPMLPKPANKRGRGGSQAGPAKPYFTLPLELTFRGRESSLRKLMTSLAESKNYFFVVRSLRIQNVKFDKPPKTGDVEFEKKKSSGGGDLFEGFNFDDLPGDDSVLPEEGTGEGGTPGEDAGAIEPLPDLKPAKDEPGSERILGQVLGDEELHVFLELELILFRPEVKLPEVK